MMVIFGMFRFNTSKIISLFIAVLLFLPLSGVTQSRNVATQDLDFQMRLEELLALPQSQNQTQKLSVLITMWARFEPSDAYIALQSNTFPPTLPISVLESMVISNWLTISPNDAIQAAINSPYPEILDLAFRDYAHQDGDAAVTLARSLKERITMDTWTGIIEGIASSEPLSAANYVLEFGDSGKQLISGFIYLLSVQDPAGAIDWLLEHYPDQTEHYDALTSRFFAIDPQGAWRYVSSLPTSLYKEKLIFSLDRAEKISNGQYP